MAVTSETLEAMVNSWVEEGGEIEEVPITARTDITPKTALRLVVRTEKPKPIRKKKKRITKRFLILDHIKHHPNDWAQKIADATGASVNHVRTVAYSQYIDLPNDPNYGGVRVRPRQRGEAPQSTLTERTADYMRANRGLTSKEIMEAMGASRNTVLTAADVMGGYTFHKEPTLVERLEELDVENYTSFELAERFETTPQYINYALRQLGLQCKRVRRYP